MEGCAWTNGAGVLSFPLLHRGRRELKWPKLQENLFLLQSTRGLDCAPWKLTSSVMINGSVVNTHPGPQKVVLPKETFL